MGSEGTATWFPYARATFAGIFAFLLACVGFAKGGEPCAAPLAPWAVAMALSLVLTLISRQVTHVVEQRTMRPGAVVVATVVQRLLQTLELALLVVGGVFLACTLPDRCDGALFAVSLASFLMIDALVAVAVVLWLIAGISAGARGGVPGRRLPRMLLRRWVGCEDGLTAYGATAEL